MLLVGIQFIDKKYGAHFKYICTTSSWYNILLKERIPFRLTVTKQIEMWFFLLIPMCLSLSNSLIVIREKKLCGTLTSAPKR